MPPFRKNQKSKAKRSGIGPEFFSALPQSMKQQIAEQVPAASLRKLMAPAKQGRYRVCAEDKRTVDGIVFDSGWESRCYTILRDGLGADRIKLQQSFELQPAFTDAEKKKHKAINYIADFVVDDMYILDAKGHLTAEYRLKEKLFAYKFGKRIIRVPFDDVGGLNTLIQKWKK